MSKQYVYFLGGADAEMQRCRQVLQESGARFYDKNLGWGAKATDYWLEIGQVLRDEDIPFLLELECDIVIADHHGLRSNEPATLLRVLESLGKTPTRLDLLIAANDARWFPGLIEMGATSEEIAYVRSLDRVAQGITPEHEAEARRALAASPEHVGGVRVIRMSHSKTAPIGDRLMVEAIEKGEKFPNYVVLSDDGEVNFSGRGDVAAALYKQFPDGWAGGAGLGNREETAFWGSNTPQNKKTEAFYKEVLDLLKETF